MFTYCTPNHYPIIIAGKCSDILNTCTYWKYHNVTTYKVNYGNDNAASRNPVASQVDRDL